MPCASQSRARSSQAASRNATASRPMTQLGAAFARCGSTLGVINRRARTPVKPNALLGEYSRYALRAASSMPAACRASQSGACHVHDQRIGVCRIGYEVQGPEIPGRVIRPAHEPDARVFGLRAQEGSRRASRLRRVPQRRLARIPRGRRELLDRAIDWRSAQINSLAPAPTAFDQESLVRGEHVRSSCTRSG